MIYLRAHFAFFRLNKHVFGKIKAIEGGGPGSFLHVKVIFKDLIGTELKMLFTELKILNGFENMAI